MISKFNPLTPEPESTMASEPIRNNFNALNDRTDNLTPSTTNPTSTRVSIGKANTVFFNNSLIPYSGGELDLGNSTSGVSKFGTPRTFKQIIVYYSNGGVLGFIESVEKIVRDHSVQSAAAIINNVSNQRIPDINGNSVNVSIDGSFPLDDSLIICSIIVANNAQAGVQGAISPIFDSDIIDLRGYLQRTSTVKALENHIEAEIFTEAHPKAKITNASLFHTIREVSSVSGGSQVNFAGDSPFFTGNWIRLTDDLNPTEQSDFITGQVLSGGYGYVILDHDVSTKAYIMSGGITLDKVAFDTVNEIKDIAYRDSTGAVVLYETSVRQSADSILQTNINNEASSRVAADSTEVSLRTSADSSLSTQISTTVSTEASARTSSDSSLTTRISTEESIRASVDSTEVSLRTSADSSLTTRVSTEESNRVAADGSFLQKANDLSDLNSASTARNNLGIYCGTETLSSGTATITLPDASVNYKIVVSYSEPILPSSGFIIWVDSKPSNDFIVKGDSNSKFDWIAIKFN